MKKILLLSLMIFVFAATNSQINYFDVKDYCLFCTDVVGDGNANDTLRDGIAQERHFFILDNDRNENPDNEEFDITLQVQGEGASKQFLILVNRKGQGVVGNIASVGSPIWAVAKLDAGVLVYAETQPGWGKGPNYGADGATSMFGVASSNPLFADYMHWNDAVSDKYIGMSLADKDDSQPLYGWIRISKPAGVDYLVIKDWAYNTIPNQPILTGDKGRSHTDTALVLRTVNDVNTITTPKGTLQLIIDVTPANVLVKTCDWYVEGPATGGISVSPAGLVTAYVNGTYYIRGTLQDGSGVHDFFEVIVTGQEPKLVTEITVKEEDGNTEITDDGGYLNLIATIKPNDASVRDVEWTVSDQSKARITADGRLVAKCDGKVTITSTAKDGSGVKATYEVTLSNQDCTLGAENISSKESVKITPNPANDFISIVVPNTTNNYSMTINDITGRQILKTNVINNQKIDLNNITKGVYFINIFENKKMISTEKLIKQ